MDNIRRILSTIVMIFPIDDINLALLKRSETINLLFEKYRLQLIQQVDPFLLNQNLLTFREGEYKRAHTSYLIDELSIDDRRIIIKMQSSSKIADSFFKALKGDLLSIDLRDKKPKYEPQITTYDTTCVCELDIDFDSSLKSVLFQKFIDETMNKLPNFGADLTITPYSLRFKIEYFNLPTKLKKNKIALSDKYLSIEYREKTDTNDRIYFSSSPTDSDTHFEILKAFEKSFRGN